MLIAVSDGDLVCARWRGGREGASSDSCLLNQGREKDCTQPAAAVSSQWITSSVTAVSRRAEPPEEENRTTSPSQRCPTAQGRLKTTEFSPENSHPPEPTAPGSVQPLLPPKPSPLVLGCPAGQSLAPSFTRDCHSQVPKGILKWESRDSSLTGEVL